MNEWALLIFTVCMQAAIGGIIVLSVFYRSINKAGEEQAFSIMRIPLVVIVALSILGLGASFAHLGSPGNAFNTILNLGSSWMSREILFTGLFIAATVVTVGLAFAKKKVSLAALIVSSLIGVVAIYCMGAIYSNSLVSGWSSANTFTSFYGTAFVLGPVLVASLIIPMLSGANYEDMVKSLIRYSFYISIFGLVVQLFGIALFATALPEVNMINGATAFASLEGYQLTVALRWIIEIVGIGVLGFLSLSFNKKLSTAFVYAALIALLFAEGMSRYVFYVLGA